jgi:tRNA threonylcarbamoyladenosine biosynthesis protein TsaE
MIEIETTSAAETRAVGRRLAGLLQPGDIVLLAGRLGAGKTVFVAGIAEGLGVDEPVTSPSFVIVHEHSGFLPMIHADVYRLGTTAELEDLELPATAEDGVLVIEWGNVIESSLPPDHLLVDISRRSDQHRRIVFTGVGTWQTRSLEELLA